MSRTTFKRGGAEPPKVEGSDGANLEEETSGKTHDECRQPEWLCIKINMFTGIVEELGTISSLIEHDASSSGGAGCSATITPGTSEFLVGALLGDSIAINGTCLTITELQETKAFKVGIAPETLRRTNLGTLKTGSKVNLERAVQASTRMGGHFVQGHVDTVARIGAKRADGNAVVFRLVPRDQSVLRYVVEKGYVALDGASLTVTAVSDAEEGTEGWWEIMMIAYTQEKVVMAAKEVGDEVNVEVDQVGKYVEKSLVGWLEGKNAAGEGLRAMVEKVVEEKLKGR